MKAIAATSLGLLLAAEAHAEITARVAVVEQPADPSSALAATAICASGSLVGGGFDTFDEDLLTGFQSEPNSTRTGWRAAMRNDGAVAGTVAVAAICDDAVPTPALVEASFPVPSDAAAGEHAFCPEGTVATSGGANATGSPGASSTMLSFPEFPGAGGDISLRGRPDGEAPAPGAWASIVAGEGISGVEGTVSVLCALRAHVVTLVESDLVPPGGLGAGVVFCPPGMAAIGGGADVTVTTARDGLRVVSSGPVFAGTPPTRLASLAAGTAGAPIGWRVALRSVVDEDRPIKIAAICAPEPGAAVLAAAAVGALATVARRGRCHAAARRPQRRGRPVQP